jgi:ribosomal protein S18 acetylase RimI-like enzyme
MADSQFSIRSLNANELSIVREIAHLTWPSSYSNIISTEQITYMLDWMYSDTALAYQLNEEKANFYLISRNNHPIGFASIGPETPNTQQNIKLHKLYVLPDFQASGAGSALMQHCILTYTEEGACKISLQVNRQNSAVAFYNKHGFIIQSEIKVDIGSGYFMDDFVMTRQLKSIATT